LTGRSAAQAHCRAPGRKRNDATPTALWPHDQDPRAGHSCSATFVLTGNDIAYGTATPPLLEQAANARLIHGGRSYDIGMEHEQIEG